MSHAVLSPIRVNGIAPGVIGTGAWDTLGEGKGRRRPVRPGQHFPPRPDSHADGGEPLT